MRNKNKKEIDMIVEVLTTHAIADDSEHTDLTLYAEEFDKVATSILSKLKIETLDRDKVEDAFDSIDPHFKKHWKNYYEHIIDKICQLAIPKEKEIMLEKMSKEYLDRKEVERILIKHRFGSSDTAKAITQLCQLRPKNQVVIAEGRFIIDSGKEFGISQRACYIKLSPRKLIGIGALGRRLEEKGVEGKKVLIILESGE